MSGWIGNNSGETAAEFLARLTTLGDYVKVSTSVGSTIAYSTNGLILRQQEEETVMEIRGVTEYAAELLKGLEADTTNTVIYYKAEGENGEYAAVGVQTGTRTTVSGQRANEAGGWRVNVTSITFSPAADDGWSTDRPDISTNVGVITSYEKTSTRVTVYGSTYDGTLSITNQESGVCYGQAASVGALYENAEITTRVFTFLSQSEAVALLEQYNTITNATFDRFKFNNNVSTIYSSTRHYTATSATSEYVDAEHGWKVTVKSIVYTPAVVYSKTDAEYTQFVFFKYDESSESWSQFSQTGNEPFRPVFIAWRLKGNFKIYEE